MTENLADIFALDDEHSVTRVKLRDPIDLRQYDIPLFIPDGDYIFRDFSISANQDTLDYRSDISDICKMGRHTGRHEKLDSGVNEAFRNAYQHGNKKDPLKKISIGYKSTETSFEVVVSDQGGLLHGDFISFVLLHRQGLHKPCPFYEFATNVVRPSENSGIGTFIMHSVADEVHYYKNQDYGLSVQLIIRKNS